MYANIVNVIISFGISAVILSSNLNFFFSFIKKNKKKISVFYSLLWFSGLIILFFFAKNLNASLKLLLIAFIIIQNIITVVETLLIKRQGEKVSFKINFIYSLLFFGYHIYILLTNYSLYFLIIGICFLSILKLIAMILVPAKTDIYSVPMNEKHFQNHWIYLGINDILGVTSKWMDKFFLLYLLTATDFAIFFNGSFEIPLFGLLISVIGSFLLIEISRDKKHPDKIIKLFHESSDMLSTIVFPLFFFLFFFRQEIFSYVFNNKYNASLPIFVISIFILPIRINHYGPILQCFGQSKKILWGAIMDIIIAVILMIILYPLMGTRGIALAVVVSTYCQVGYYLWHSAKILNISISKILPFRKLFIKFLVAMALYVLLFFILSGTEIKLKLLIVIVITGIVIVAGMVKYIKLFLKKDNVLNSYS